MSKTSTPAITIQTITSVAKHSIKIQAQAGLTITLTNAGNIRTIGGVNKILVGNGLDFIELEKRGSNWFQINIGNY
mgnify:CR=1 FL=1